MLDAQIMYKSTPGNLYFSLHSSDPLGPAPNEITYQRYARVVVHRSDILRDLSRQTPITVEFPSGAGGSGVATHFGYGFELSGPAKPLHAGTVSPSVVVGQGITPRLRFYPSLFMIDELSGWRGDISSSRVERLPDPRYPHAKACLLCGSDGYRGANIVACSNKGCRNHG